MDIEVSLDPPLSRAAMSYRVGGSPGLRGRSVCRKIQQYGLYFFLECGKYTDFIILFFICFFVCVKYTIITLIFFKR